MLWVFRNSILINMKKNLNRIHSTVTSRGDSIDSHKGFRWIMQSQFSTLFPQHSYDWSERDENFLITTSRLPLLQSSRVKEKTALENNKKKMGAKLHERLFLFSFCNLNISTGGCSALFIAPFLTAYPTSTRRFIFFFAKFNLSTCWMKGIYLPFYPFRCRGEVSNKKRTRH